jgi:CubicO group peptidase (beta-lactamase class C family)
MKSPCFGTILCVLTFLFFGVKLVYGQQKNTDSSLQLVLNKATDGKIVHGTSIFIDGKNGKWKGSTGNLSTESPYFIASTTKLYTTAVILHLESQKKLKLTDSLIQYFSQQELQGLHILNQIDWSQNITIGQLLSNTSGLPDYFEDKDNNGNILMNNLLNGKDQSWNFQDVLQLTKQMKPKFPPGEKGKAHYSDSNFQLLGEIIERISGKSISQMYEELIFKPLKLTDTYLFLDTNDKRPLSMYYKEKPLNIPLAMSSVKADGGIVSTAEESAIFLQAFFGGYFFDKSKIKTLYDWKPVMFPLEYGMGIMRFKLPKMLTLGKEMPELIGHSGLSGAFAYYIPSKSMFIAGTVNQLDNPGTSYKVILKLIQLYQP